MNPNMEERIIYIIDVQSYHWSYDEQERTNTKEIIRLEKERNGLIMSKSQELMFGILHTIINSNRNNMDLILYLQVNNRFF